MWCVLGCAWVIAVSSCSTYSGLCCFQLWSFPSFYTSLRSCKWGCDVQLCSRSGPHEREQFPVLIHIPTHSSKVGKPIQTTHVLRGREFQVFQHSALPFVWWGPAFLCATETWPKPGNLRDIPVRAFGSCSKGLNSRLGCGLGSPGNNNSRCAESPCGARQGCGRGPSFIQPQTEWAVPGIVGYSRKWLLNISAAFQSVGILCLKWFQGR